jgi:hypothetical protein
MSVSLAPYTLIDVLLELAGALCRIRLRHAGDSPI